MGREDRIGLFSGAKYSKRCDRFYEIFGRRLRDFDNSPWGFDIVAFDEWLKVPMDGKTSTRSFIEENYGVEAVSIIEDLIKA